MRILRKFWEAVKHTLGNEDGLFGIDDATLALILGGSSLGLGAYQTILGANQPKGASQGGRSWGDIPPLYTPGSFGGTPPEPAPETIGDMGLSETGVPPGGLLAGGESPSPRGGSDFAQKFGQTMQAADLGMQLIQILRGQTPQVLQGSTSSMGNMPSLYSGSQDMTLEELMKILAQYQYRR
jgi:hypothetical protein